MFKQRVGVKKQMQSFISGQPSVQGEEGDGLPNQTNEMVEFGWNMIKVNTAPIAGGGSNSANVSLQGEVVQSAAAASNPAANG